MLGGDNNICKKNGNPKICMINNLFVPDIQTAQYENTPKVVCYMIVLDILYGFGDLTLSCLTDHNFQFRFQFGPVLSLSKHLDVKQVDRLYMCWL